MTPSIPTREAPFTERLADRVQSIGSRLIVGIDPVIDRFPEALRSLDPEAALAAFGHGILDAVADVAVMVKPQIAFFERYGWRGWRALQSVVEHAATRGVPVLLDAKRGDIGSTAAAYADAFFGDDPETPGPWVDALTINPYLGKDSIDPFLNRSVESHRGLFVLSRTSNPGGADFQSRATDGEPLYLGVARAATRWMAETSGADGGAYGPIGLVVGATYPEELAEVREAAPRSWLLLPGLGVQGGTAKDVVSAFDGAGLGALASSSRGIIYAYEGRDVGDWTEPVHAQAKVDRDSLQSVL